MLFILASGFFYLDIDMRPIVRKRILDRDGHKCQNCASVENLQIDHIIPLCRGGYEEESNMQVLCQKCNLKKGKSINIEPYIKLGVDQQHIELRRDFPLHALTPVEFAKTIEWLFKRNDILCLKV